MDNWLVSRYRYANQILVSRYRYAKPSSVPLENLVSHLGDLGRKQGKQPKPLALLAYKGIGQNLVSRYRYETKLTIFRTRGLRR